jgi:hypothetical protein
MAIVSMHELTLHPGARGFRLGFQDDPESDRKLYDAGVALESVRVEEGSAAKSVFEKLSSSQPPSSVAPVAMPMSKATSRVR